MGPEKSPGKLILERRLAVRCSKGHGDSPDIQDAEVIRSSIWDSRRIPSAYLRMLRPPFVKGTSRLYLSRVVTASLG